MNTLTDTRPAARAATLAGLVLGLVAALLAGTSTRATASPTSSASTTSTKSAPAAAHPVVAKKSRGTAVWDATTVGLGGTISVHGVVKAPKAKRHKHKHHKRVAVAEKKHKSKKHHKKLKIQLQVKTKSGWNTLAKTKTDKHGIFAVAAPASWYGAHTMRVATKGGGHFTSKQTVTVPLTWAPRGNPAIWHPLNPDYPIRFNPCEPVTYRINPGSIGTPGVALIQLGLAQISAVTGIPVQYVGTTTNIPWADLNHPIHTEPGTKLDIAFASNAQVPLFATQQKAGYGGVFSSKPARTRKGKLAYATKEAGVSFSEEYYADFAKSYDSTTGPTAGELIIHELGHAFGLGHTPEDADQIMNGFTYERYPDGHWRGIYAAGDITGLNAVGYGQGCLKTVKHAKVTASTATVLD